MKNYKKLEQLKELVEMRTDTLDLSVKSRKGHLPIYRSFFINLARELTHSTVEEVGKSIGRDHSTVVYWCKEQKNVIRFEKNLKTLYAELRAEAMILFNIDLAYFFDNQSQKVLDEMLIKC